MRRLVTVALALALGGCANGLTYDPPTEYLTVSPGGSAWIYWMIYEGRYGVHGAYESKGQCMRELRKTTSQGHWNNKAVPGHSDNILVVHDRNERGTIVRTTWFMCWPAGYDPSRPHGSGQW